MVSKRSHIRMDLRNMRIVIFTLLLKFLPSSIVLLIDISHFKALFMFRMKMLK